MADWLWILILCLAVVIGWLFARWQMRDQTSCEQLTARWWCSECNRLFETPYRETPGYVCHDRARGLYEWQTGELPHAAMCPECGDVTKERRR